MASAPSMRALVAPPSRPRSFEATAPLRSTTRPARWSEAAKLVEAGRLAPLMAARSFDFDAALEAHREVESGRSRGRVVVNIGQAVRR